MKCYTYQADTGKLTDGIVLAGHDDFGPSVTLGAEGRGNVVSRISLDKKFPPVLDGDTLFTSGFKAVTLQPNEKHRQARTFHVFSAVNEHRPGVIVLVRDCRACTAGMWATILGSGWKRVGRYVTDDVLVSIEEDGSTVVLDHAGNTVVLSAEGDSLYVTKR